MQTDRMRSLPGRCLLPMHRERTQVQCRLARSIYHYPAAHGSGWYDQPFYRPMPTLNQYQTCP
jgi:hypothetical protein